MLARFAATFVVAAALVGGCKKDRPRPTTTEKPTAAQDCAAEGEGGSFQWIENSYDRALRCAKHKHVPLMIDMWAPWCHTCLSMKAYVLTDPKLADYARRFVFVALDTDEDINAAVVKKFPPQAWPTYFVVDESDESIQSRFVGAASVEQFAAFLADGERGHLAKTGTQLTAWDAKARDGDQAASRKDWPAAAAAYQAALAAAPKDWVRTPDALVSVVGADLRAKAYQDCLQVATARIGDTGSSASASEFSGRTNACASELLEVSKDPADVQLATAARQKVVERLSALTADAGAPLSVDDRSDALMYLREALDALGRADDAKAAAQQQRKLLDDAAAAAKTPMEASTYNWPRSEVYLYLGVPLELVPALEKSAADLPEEYDPPYRLAWIYWKGGKLDEAKTWIKKALGWVYGPRKTRALAMLADIEKARGDVDGERAARQAIVKTWMALPAAAQDAEAIAQAKAAVAAVGSGSGAPIVAH